MKKITREYKIYKYNELGKKAKEIALQNYINDNDYLFLPEYMQDELSELLKKHKITGEAKILYSLAYCQGDGSMFYGQLEWKKYDILVKHSGHYYHYNSKTIEMTDKKTGDWCENEKDIEQFEKLYVKICKELEKVGYAYIENENSENTFKELSKSNGYTFLASGVMMNE